MLLCRKKNPVKILPFLFYPFRHCRSMRRLCPLLSCSCVPAALPRGGVQRHWTQTRFIAGGDAALGELKPFSFSFLRRLADFDISGKQV